MGVSLSLSNLGRSTLSFSVGDFAKQANGSACVSLGDTMVLATACMAKEPTPEYNYLPLFVEYQEKTYAMGKIPGGFIKKEGRPKDREILSARLIDRPLRPFFPKGLTNEIQIIAMVLSSDGENDPDVLAINAASCALLISDIPFDTFLAAVRVAFLEDKFILNPTYKEREKSCLDLVIVATEEKVVMLEGAFDRVEESVVLEAIKFAQNPIREIINLQKSLRKKVGKAKQEVSLFKINEDLLNCVRDKIYSQIDKIYGLVEKEEREKALFDIFSSLCDEFLKEDSPTTKGELKNALLAIEEEIFRKKILEKEMRPDGRKLRDIRPIECKVGVLPRTHGAALFSRGQTQALALTTLGTSSDVQFIEALEGELTKHFMIHYSFPPFSVGEIKPLRGPSRRDIGHGALAEKALFSVIPPKEDFPYTIRVVSEILESNGSSSMATVCASSLSLMDAGVPLKEPVAGIALGLVSGDKDYKILTDIAGVEDQCGDMDFKLAGTKSGVTAIQLDVKIDGLTLKIIADTLAQAKEVRLNILDKMNAALSLPRKAVSKYAPKIKSFKIDPDKIGDVIGPGGRIIRKLSRENNVTIDIDDEEEVVSVVAESQEDLDRAVNQIINLTKEIELGEVFEVKITRLANFGAFCEIAPGKTGLIRISEISHKFVKDIGEFLKEGDIVNARVVNIDPQGRIALSIKQAEENKE